MKPHEVIQGQLDGDITTSGGVAFQEYFGERAVAALNEAGYIVVPGDEHSTEQLAEVFKAAWHRADEAQMTGARTKVGIATVLATLRGEL